MLPQFLIAGFPKCGTTTIQHTLKHHPNIFMPNREVHFFDRNWKEGIGWYHDLFKNFTGDGVIGERTPAYSWSWYIHHLIKKNLPQVKIIIALRNPINRSFSEWNMGRRKNLHTMSFEHKANKELNQKRIDHCGTLYKGKYIDHINHLLKFFPREQLHFVITERIDKSFDELQEFIGVPIMDLPTKRYFVGEYNHQKVISKSMRKKLKRYFRQSNKKLFEFLGEEIPEWDSIYFE